WPWCSSPDRSNRAHRGGSVQRWRTATHVLCWLGVVPMAAFVAARVLAPDARSVLVALNAATAVVLLPAWLVAIVAGVLRLRVLFVIAMLLVGAHVALLWPEMAARADVPRAALTAPKIVVFDANVFAENGDIKGIGAEIEQARADVVTLQEASPSFVGRLDAQSVLADLPYRVSVPRTDPFAFAIASRFPLRDTTIVSDGQRPVIVETTLEAPGRIVRLFVVHTLAPFGPNRPGWERDLASIRREARRQRQTPLLGVGDFNAT